MGHRLAMVTGWLGAARRFGVAGVRLAALSHLSLACAAEPAPLADFFRHPAVTVAVMSPAGRHIAALMSGGAEKRQRLVVIDPNNVAAAKVVASFVDADIASVHWVNDDRLVFTVSDRQAPLGDQPGQGLFSVDRQGALPMRRLIKTRQYFLTEPTAAGDRELSVTHWYHSSLRDGSNDVVVGKLLVDARYEITDVALLRLDTVSGRTRVLTEGAPPFTRAWALDRQGVPRVAASANGGKNRLYWKPTADASEWVFLREYDTFADRGDLPAMVGVGADNQMYGVAPADKGADTASLLRIEVQSGELKAQPMVTLAGFDFSGRLAFDSRGQLLGVHFTSDAPATHWYDAKLKAMQQQIDALLPSTNNRIDCGDCADPAVVLVASTSDRQPLVFRLFDARTGKLDTLARARPWIDPAVATSRDLKRFAARDGLGIPLHVTLPRGVTGPAPMVVLVHGGPWVRGGSWRWYAESQFLASRGYVVIEPEFRGSTGYGAKLFRAGWKQWGLAMQDDLADATRWAVAQGLADPKRVCIAGASYGGYAVLMGLIRDPDLFRCGVEWVGVSDIELMYSINWSDSSEMWKAHGMPALIGDREKDAAQLAATSPLKLASKLTRPLLMAYGSDDYRVPLEHGTRMRDAVKPFNPDVEFVVYPGEAHGWMLESTSVDFWGRVERFLARQIGPGAAP